MSRGFVVYVTVRTRNLVGELQDFVGSPHKAQLLNTPNPLRHKPGRNQVEISRDILTTPPDLLLFKMI